MEKQSERAQGEEKENPISETSSEKKENDDDKDASTDQERLCFSIGLAHLEMSPIMNNILLEKTYLHL